MNNYSEIEKKWQKFWQENETFKASNKSDKEKYYILVEFPYPSGSGLHVGHIRSYTALDAMARLKRMQGFNVLFPMGWDAFGAPAEKYAIDNKVHPQDAVKECIRIFKGQMQTLGFSFDWSREFSTTDPDYYKWTQWQFLKFFEQGMAYKAKKEINWCPNCEMGLSNEDSAGGVCERCGSKVEKREKEQWMLKMKDYAESLLDGLGNTEFVDRVKTAQINWIGKSEGAYVDFKIKDSNDVLKVFTTRSDTLYGVTFMVMSPEHPFVEKYQDRIKNMAEVRAYQKEAQEKSEIERTDATKEKTGVKLDGFVVINPVNNQEIPVWISDYVLANYGTGAIMAVPAHDDRDFAFATKFGIPVVQVIERITGKIREDEKKKESIVAVVYNPQNKKYLTINWHDKGGRLFIGGTIKDGETPVECALREIEEETGYTDLKLLNEGFKINHHYYAFNKNQAFNIEATPIYFELLSEKNADTNLDDDEVFDVEWALEKVVQHEILDELHHACYEGIKEPFYCGDGIHINSDIINGLNNETALETMNKYLVDNGIGEPTTTYRLDDWIFSRQRFWGEPIPLIHCEEHGWVAVPKEDLPVLLPDVVNYEPTKDGESPLANIKEWVLAPCPICGKQGNRETDTMPNWAGSSWYWLRYMDPKNEQEFADMEAMKYWGQVDYYNGGMEHAARHLLYARFWNQFMYDQGLVAVREPFLKRVAHGMILGENSEKMSKSKGNVINPDDMVKEYGADALRIYEMFIGDYEKDASWSENGLKGCKRFLDRVYRLKEKIVNGDNYSKDLENIIHKTIKKVTEDILTMNYNTAISSLMILVNAYDAKESITKGDYQVLLTLLNPVAPHLTEELNELCGFKDIICNRKWPEYNEAKLIDDTVTIAVSVNGKLRATIEVVVDMPQNELISLAKKQENVQKFIDNKEIVKEIVVPNKIVNIVVK